MPSKQQLEAALINADKAGDAQAAQMLATALKNNQFDSVEQPVSRLEKTAKILGSVATGTMRFPNDTIMGDVGNTIQSGIVGLRRGAASLVGLPVDTGSDVSGLATAAQGYVQGEIVNPIRKWLGAKTYDLPEPINREEQVGGSGNIKKNIAEFYKDKFGLRSPFDTPNGTKGEENIAMAAGIMGAGLLNPASSVRQSAANVGKMILPAGGAVLGKDLAETGFPGNNTAAVVGSLAGMAAGGGLQLGVGKIVDKTGIGAHSEAGAKALVKEQVKADLADAKLTQQTALDKLKEMGPDATIADITGRAQARAASVAQLPGAGSDAAAFYKARNVEAGKRGADAVDQTVKGRIDLSDQKELIVERGKAAVAPLYDEAYKQFPSLPPNSSRELTRLAGDKTVAEAIKRTNELYRAKGLKEVTPETIGLEGWVEVRRQLDRIAYGRAPPPANRRLPQDTEVARALRRRLDDELKLLTTQNFTDPGTGLLTPVNKLKEADAIHAGRRQVDEAFDLGEKFLSQRPRTIEKTLGKMSQSERDAYKLAALQTIYSKATKTTDGGSVYNQIFGSGDKRDNVKAALQDDIAFANLKKTMDNEKIKNETFVKTNMGSDTAKKILGAQELGLDPVMTQSILTGNPTAAVVQLITRKLSAVTVPKALRKELVDVLTTPGQGAADRLKKIYEEIPQGSKDRARFSQLMAIQAALPKE